MRNALGPVMLDLAGPELSAAESELLRHPLVGGLILFSRNYRSPRQLCELTATIRALRTPELLIAVDHEGGRVQRFRDGFTAIPAMRRLGEAWDRDRTGACAAAHDIAYVLAGELLACGVDFSFTPVLDVDFGASGVIGDRALHPDPAAIAQLSAALIAGLRAAGMAGVGKHFPGHGYVRADSHLAVPLDERSYAEIEAADLLPYRELIKQGLAAVMPAHVIYPKVDARPAGFSPKWLQQVLRGQLNFDGMIFSDDLSMEARMAGGMVERAGRACSRMRQSSSNAPRRQRWMGSPALEQRRAGRCVARGGQGREVCSTMPVSEAKAAWTASPDAARYTAPHARPLQPGLPRLPAARGLSRSGAKRPSRLSRAAGAGVRRSRGRVADRRPGAGHARRQPNRKAVYGRSCGPHPVPDPVCVRFRQPAGIRARR
jgi:beta-N-acetylhexosaminidase